MVHHRTVYKKLGFSGVLDTSTLNRYDFLATEVFVSILTVPAGILVPSPRKSIIYIIVLKNIDQTIPKIIQFDSETKIAVSRVGCFKTYASKDIQFPENQGVCQPEFHVP